MERERWGGGEEEYGRRRQWVILELKVNMNQKMAELRLPTHLECRPQKKTLLLQERCPLFIWEGGAAPRQTSPLLKNASP